VHNFKKKFGLNFLDGSFHVHTFFNVRLDDHTPCLYNVKIGNGKQTIWDKF